VALAVIERGFDAHNVYALVGGLQAWEAAGYAVE
jgi:rhodanese-related sulfurtransferase